MEGRGARSFKNLVITRFVIPFIPLATPFLAWGRWLLANGKILPGFFSPSPD
jgi:hypothetical protein